MAAAMGVSGNSQGGTATSAAQGQSSASASGPTNVHMKNQLQGAASNILAGTAGQPEQSQEQYEDLKKKLLHEYKKMQKKGGGALS